MEHILIVEDDVHISELLNLHLKSVGFQVTTVFDGDLALELAMNNDYSMLLLDLMLPGKSGLEICTAVRKKKQNLPILMLTARSEERDKIIGFETGADDYIVKPFSIKEIIARVNAILRRTKAMKAALTESNKKLVYDNLSIDFESRVTTLDGNRIELSPKEFDLLYHMAKHPGRSYSRQQLLDAIWGYQFDGFEHTVNSHINRLRAKIEKNVTQPNFILTTWGVGYRFNSDL